MASEATIASAKPPSAYVGVARENSRTNEVWHVRHGERCDEVRGAERRAWENSPRYKTGGWFDPSLTRHGHVQACRAGEYLKSLPFNRQQQQQQQQQPGSFDVVYTSPLVRAVQTAVCVSQGLGNLPLQVVPGLCSCTAALMRIGYPNAQATLMTDEDIIQTFPGVTVLPRDPLAPTSFVGAAAWLATKAGERKSVGGDGDGKCFSRVLAVGHREGTKAMAGRKVPTPHCCIGIFKAETSGNTYTYELHDLLSHTGKSLKSTGGSSYARRTMTSMEEKGARSDGEDGGGTVEALAARVISLTVDMKGPEPKANGHGIEGDARKREDTRVGASSRSISAPPSDPKRRSWSRTTGLVRRLRGVSSSLRPPAEKGKPPAAMRGAAGRGPGLATREPLRRARSKGTTVVRLFKREGNIGAASGGGGSQTGKAPGRATEVCPRQAAAAATHKSGRVVSGAASMGVAGKNRAETPRNDTLAGRGFRVAVRHSSRRCSLGGGSTYAGFLGVPVDMICGPSGVLSFLSHTELCTVQAVCLPIATASTSESLWGDLYSRLPKVLRDRSEVGLPQVGEATPREARTQLHPKTRFATAVSTASCAHAAKIAKKVAVVRRRLAVIHNLRHSVNAMRGNVSVTINGEPVRIVQTTGVRTEAWVSRPSLLSEPFVNRNDGVRTFSLSSSVKVEVPASLEAVEGFRSLCVALSWPDKDAALIPRMAVVRIDDRLPLYQVRILGKSADGAVVLYDVTGSSHSNTGNSNGSCNRLCTRKGGEGTRETQLSPSVLRGCALLGVLPASSQDATGGSGTDAGGIAFITVHFPHDLLLDIATRGRVRGIGNNPPGSSSGSQGQSYSDDLAGPKHGLQGFSAALGLRTAGVPLWEKASTAVDGRVCPPRNVAPQQSPTGGDPGAAVLCIDILRAGVNEAASFGGGLAAGSDSDRTLSAGLGIPYSTPGGLSGIVADALLADFTLCDADGASLWAFTSPVVFEACLTSGSANTPGVSGGREGDDGTVDMAHEEIREERRRGIVSGSGVGRVVVELALVESSSDDDRDDELVRSSATQRSSCPAGHVWMVRSARVELELNFVNAWFGTQHSGGDSIEWGADPD